MGETASVTICNYVVEREEEDGTVRTRVVRESFPRDSVLSSHNVPSAVAPGRETEMEFFSCPRCGKTESIGDCPKFANGSKGCKHCSELQWGKASDDRVWVQLITKET